MIDSRTRSTIRRKLLAWFDANRRELPWRKRTTPYRVWVSEIMLQQTQVATVVDYYQRFIRRFPNLKQLAQADEAEVLRFWEGLGYYRRARQMHRAAKQILASHGGRFPREFSEVVALPGIGRYTAGAILSIACDQPWPILEGNTIRLFARLTGMQSDPRTTDNQKRLWQLSESLVTKHRPGDLNQSLMELGATICRPQNPRCEICPIRNECVARIKGIQTRIPPAARKLKYESISEAVVLVQRRSRYLVRRCGNNERWAGLWDFPRYAANSDSPEYTLKLKLEQHTGLIATVESSGLTIQHAVTRFRITLDCYIARQVSGRVDRRNDPSLVWKPLDEIAELPMSVTGRKIAERVRRGLDIDR